MLPVSLFAQAKKIEISKEGEAKIKELATRFSKLNQDLLNNSVSAFDAIYSRLDGVKVESKDLEGYWTFSLNKVLDKTLSYMPLSEGLSLLKDVYKINSEQSEKDIRIADATATNTMKGILAKIAEQRTATFSVNESAIAAMMREKANKEGIAYLIKVESSLTELNNTVLKMIGGVKTQVLLFQFEILEELINGLRKSYKSKEFVICEVRMTGCDMSGWESSLTNKTATCPTIQRARFVFSGGLSSQFRTAANEILRPLLSTTDIASRLYLSDLDIDFHFRIHPPGLTEDCAVMVPVSRRNRKVTITGNIYWRNCSGRDGMFLYQTDSNSKLKSLVQPIIDRIAKANVVLFGMPGSGEEFFEDTPVKY